VVNYNDDKFDLIIDNCDSKNYNYLSEQIKSKLILKKIEKYNYKEN